MGTVYLQIDELILEVHRGGFGYFKCDGCENQCERCISWADLFPEGQCHNEDQPQPTS